MNSATYDILERHVATDIESLVNPLGLDGQHGGLRTHSYSYPQIRTRLDPFHLFNGTSISRRPRRHNRGSSQLGSMHPATHVPAMSGWPSHPSCVFALEKNNITICATCTFSLAFGILTCASKDRTKWRPASQILS
jgi:hypothetical protein